MTQNELNDWSALVAKYPMHIEELEAIQQLIAKHYKSKDEILRAIGEDEECLLPQTEENVIKYQTVSIRNKQRHQIKEALGIGEK